MKLAYILSAFALTLSLSSCNEQPKETTTIIEKTVEVAPPTVVVEKEVIIVEKEVVVEKEKGTTIELGPNGGSLKTTDVKIEVKD